MNAALSLKPVLALHGGTPVRTSPLPTWPVFAEDEIAAVAQVMRSGRVNYSTGEQGRAFELEFAHACGTNHAVAVANGTLALELALRCLGIRPGDHVVTSSRAFVACGSCIVMLGAIPIFADVDRNTQNMTVDTIRAVLTPETRAIIAVHLGGHPCDMDSLVQLAEERNLRLIEDCAQAQGATYRGRPVGSFGHAATFSFCNDKLISTMGEGGMLTTNLREVWERAAAFRDQGAKPQLSPQSSNGNGFRWVHDSIGTNWRMTEAQAAVGRIQLKKSSCWLDRRRVLSGVLRDRLTRIQLCESPQCNPILNLLTIGSTYSSVRKGSNKDGIETLFFTLSVRNVCVVSAGAVVRCTLRRRLRHGVRGLATLWLKN